LFSSSSSPRLTYQSHFKNRKGQELTMMAEKEKIPTSELLEKMVAEADTGGRTPHGSIPKAILFVVPLLWSLFQLWYS
jgi:hypothetical protein